jgi:hypothetical protein
MHTMSPLQARAAVGLLTLGLTAAAAEMARAPHLVSFTDAIAAPVQQAEAVTIAQPSTGHIVPASYSPANQPHEVLLKAVMPQPTVTPKFTRTHKPRTRPHAIRIAAPEPIAIEFLRPVRPSARPTYVLTEFTPSYAAVPFGNGWLIIQL